MTMLLQALTLSLIALNCDVKRQRKRVQLLQEEFFWQGVCNVVWPSATGRKYLLAFLVSRPS